jgi:integrase
LTGARREEIAAAKRKEIKGRYLIVPPDRAKKDREHRIYLADEAMAVMAKLPRIRTHGGFVFTTTGKSSVSGWSKAKDRLDELSGVTGWTIHDLRRTVASGMQSIGVPIHITEKCLAHHSGTFAGITGVYQQFGYEDEMKDAWERWAKRLVEIVR